MNKILKKIAVLALAGTMTLGMSVNALAADNGKNPDSSLKTANNGANSDTEKINLIKHYICGTATASGIKSPAEDFIFTITPYGVWNAGSSTGDANGAAYSVDNMPAFAIASMNVTLNNDKTNVVTIPAGLNQAGSSTDASTSIKLSDYNSVGDFWYKVEETNSKTTGVFYGTNSVATPKGNTTEENGTYSRVYYIHVQVVNNPDYNNETPNSKKFLRSVTMHKTAPINNVRPTTNVAYNTWAESNYLSEVKVNNIQNTYYAGDLVIKKNVTGNAGDKDEYFKVTVVFTKPMGTIVNSDIPFTAVAKNGDSYTSTDFTIKGQYDNGTNTGNHIIQWTGNGNNGAKKTATCTFYVKDNSTVTFSNIPYGINYTIQEEKPADDTYKHQFKFDGTTDGNASFDGQILTTDKGTDILKDDFNDQAEGSISDENDTVTIENNKESTIDIGVVTTNAPYIAMLILAAAALVLFVHRRKTMIEE